MEGFSPLRNSRARPNRRRARSSTNPIVTEAERHSVRGNREEILVASPTHCNSHVLLASPHCRSSTASSSAPHLFCYYIHHTATALLPNLASAPFNSPSPSYWTSWFDLTSTDLLDRQLIVTLSRSERAPHPPSSDCKSLCMKSLVLDSDS